MRKDIKTENISACNLIKLFRFNDLFVYLALLLLTTALFLCFALKKDLSPKGFLVNVGDKTVITFYYDEGSPIVNPEFNDSVIYDKQNNSFTVYLDKNKTEFNVITFDKNNFSVKVTESNCSNTKECVNSPAVSANGLIFCAPHDLRVVPISNKPTTPSVGG